MKKLHLFGITIITLVVAAFLNTPAFLNNLSIVTKIEIWLLVVLLILITSSTIIRVFINNDMVPMFVPATLGICLFIVSAAIFFGNVDYFWHGINLAMPFWHRVSFYTLPAISLESSIVTGFEYVMNKAGNLSIREKSWITKMFFSYTILTMVINFMAIGKIINVGLHISIARIVIISSMGIIILVLVRKSKSQSKKHLPDYR